MARHKNQDWSMPEGTPNGKGGSTHSWESIHASIAMDVRDELQRLNALLQCKNFISIPGELRAIKRELATMRKERAK